MLFGGINGVGINNWFGDTWEFAAGAWTQRASTNHPAVRFGHALAFDATRGRVVMFGGRSRTSPIFLADTWEWDGTNWLPFLPAHAPSARMGHALAFDPVLGRVLLFGGLQIGGPYVNDTWTWDGVDWAQQAPAHAPTPRGDAALATDVARGRAVLYGGHDLLGFTDTWQWDGGDWTALPSALDPGDLTLPTLATGPAGRHLVLFGGDDPNGVPQAATWRHGELATVRAFGSGCGAPPLVLAAAPGATPALGSTFASAFAPVPQGALPFQSLGFSATTFSGIPLPLPLDALGMPGCTLYHDMAWIFLPCTLATDVATHALPIPNDSTLVGQLAWLEGYALAPGANAFGVITTNALELRVGHP